MRKIFYSFLFLLIFASLSRVYAQPSPPTLLTPANGDTNVSKYPTFTWTNVSGATSYHLRVYQGLSLVVNQANITSTSYSITQNILDYSTWYTWNVASANGSGEGPPSNSFTFRTTVQAPPPPVLSTPQNNAINVSITPFLDWENSTGASSYRLQVSTSPTFGSTVIDVPGLVNSGYQVPSSAPLQNSVTYYWRVNATNPGGTSDWATPFSFTTVVIPPIAPTLNYPANGAIGIPVTLTFKWLAISPAVLNYEIQVSENAQFNGTVIDENPVDTFYTTPQGVLSGTQTYYWRVRAANVAGYGNWSSPIRSFTTGIAPPAAPVLINPLNAAINVPINGVLFDWNNVSGATSYRIQISIDSNFVTTLVNQNTGTASQYTHNTPNFAYSTTYYWRVQATNSAGTGLWSQVWNFHTIDAPLPPPTLISPPNGATGIVLTPTLDWGDVSGATGYRVQVATTTAFNPALIDQTVTESQYTIPSGILQGYTTYYWRVATRNGSQLFGSFSANWNFQTVQTFNLNLKVYLEGFYNGTTGNMIPDTVSLYLAQNVSPYAFKDSSLAFVGTTGQTSTISFARATTGSYYIVVKHRNHLETWSKNPQSFTTGNAVNYNFTDSAGKAFGNNMKQVGTVWVFYGGDANQDGYILPSDYDIYKTQFGLWGYKACDFNGDSFVDGYDFPIFYSNLYKNKQRPY